jgi:hypothetical protein
MGDWTVFAQQAGHSVDYALDITTKHTSILNRPECVTLSKMYSCGMRHRS